MGKKSILFAVSVLGLACVGCNPTGTITVAGPSGQLKVVLKEDDADLATAKRLATGAIEKFVEQNGRFPTEKETRKLKVSWYGENHLAGITDIVSHTETKKPSQGLERSSQ